MWQTAWDAGLDMQVLKNSRQEFHPACLSAKALIQTLDHFLNAEALDKTVIGNGREKQNGIEKGIRLDDKGIAITSLTGLLENLRLELVRAIANPEPQALQRLEAAEKELAEHTHSNLIWEAYRIAINGLSLQNLPLYLTQRQARFYLALQEENQINKSRMG